MTISMVYQFWTTGRGNIAIVSWIFMIIAMTFRLGHLGWHPIQPGKLQLINSNLTMEELIYISYSTYLIKWKIFEWNYHEKIRYFICIFIKILQPRWEVCGHSRQFLQTVALSEGGRDSGPDNQHKGVEYSPANKDIRRGSDLARPGQQSLLLVKLSN